ncbi:hypothetical protein ANCCAN_22079, partial [Ancylostoma caninum]
LLRCRCTKVRFCLFLRHELDHPALLQPINSRPCSKVILTLDPFKDI